MDGTRTADYLCAWHALSGTVIVRSWGCRCLFCVIRAKLGGKTVSTRVVAFRAECAEKGMVYLSCSRGGGRAPGGREREGVEAWAWALARERSRR